MLPTLASLFYHFDITIETPEPNFLRSLKTRAQIEKQLSIWAHFFFLAFFVRSAPVGDAAKC